MKCVIIIHVVMQNYNIQMCTQNVENSNIHFFLAERTKFTKFTPLEHFQKAFVDIKE